MRLRWCRCLRLPVLLHANNQYTDSEDYKVGFYVDLIDNHWFLFSSKGVFKFDQNFENVQHLLDESIFENNQLW